MRRECRERFPRHRLQRKPLISDASRQVHDARAVLHVGIANPRWRGKRSRHSRHMCNPQVYVSGKRPMVISNLLVYLYACFYKLRVTSNCYRTPTAFRTVWFNVFRTQTPIYWTIISSFRDNFLLAIIFMWISVGPWYQLFSNAILKIDSEYFHHMYSFILHGTSSTN